MVLIEELADTYGVEEIPELNSDISDFASDVYSICQGYDKGESTIEKMLKEKGIEDVYVYNPARGELTFGQKVAIASLTFLILGGMYYFQDKD